MFVCNVFFIPKMVSDHRLRYKEQSPLSLGVEDDDRAGHDCDYVLFYFCFFSSSSSCPMFSSSYIMKAIHKEEW